MTFFQDPYVVEDTFGFKFPVPAEYGLELLNNIIKWRFQGHDCYVEIQAGNYELFRSKDSTAVISTNTWLPPGTAITMAIIVAGLKIQDQTCPMPNCGSTESIIVLGGGRQWYVIFHAFET